MKLVLTDLEGIDQEHAGIKRYLSTSVVRLDRPATQFSRLLSEKLPKLEQLNIECSASKADVL